MIAFGLRLLRVACSYAYPISDKNVCLLIVIFSFPGDFVHASNDLYIQLKENNSEMAFGYYTNPKIKKVESAQRKLSQITTEDLKGNLPVDPEKHTLIFIHAMWGNGKGSQKGNLKTFRKLCGPDYQIINVVWKAGHLNYKKNWNRAILTGQALAPIFGYLMQQESQGFHVFCHSMGNRIFEGMLSKTTGDFQLGKVILMASDLDTTVFDHHLACLKTSAQQVNVYFHQNDRALKISKRRHKRNRLGLNATILDPEWKGKIKFIDVTQTKAKGSKGLSRHLYYRKDEKVKSDLRAIFSGNPDHNRDRRALKILDEKKYLYAL